MPTLLRDVGMAPVRGFRFLVRRVPVSLLKMIRAHPRNPWLNHFPNTKQVGEPAPRWSLVAQHSGRGWMVLTRKVERRKRGSSILTD